MVREVTEIDDTMARPLITAAAATIVLLTAALAAVPSPAQRADSSSPPDFSGVWVSDPNHLESLHFVDRIPQGWRRHVENVRLMKEYRLEITQSADRIVVVFPRGTASFPTLPGFPFGRQESHVTDRSTSSMKVTTRAWWDGSMLTLSGTQMAVPKGEDIDSATPDDTAIISRHVLLLNEAGDRLTMTTTLSDEKGSTEYRQVFRRQR